MTQTFSQFCENELSIKKFKALYQLAKDDDITKYSITNALKYPQKMSFKLLKKIATTIGITAIDLVEKYECGLDKMTAREYKSLLD